MPKFGIKCFLGSFILSLGAVFAATSAYHYLSQENSLPSPTNEDLLTFTEAELHNIELFSANETDPVSAAAFDEVTVASASDTTTEVQLAQNDDILNEEPVDDQTPDQLTPEEHEILYTPSSVSNPPPSIGQETDIAANEPTDKEDISEVQNTEAAADNELKIADASEAPVFKIPLRHSYNVANREKISVSDQSASNQIAMASQNVVLDNLGINDSTASADALIEPILPSTDSNPWEVAEVANQNASKNSLAKIVPNQPEPAKAENETQVAYKMQKNLLIPIPDEIMNDKNLTPQISSSSENKKLEEELRREKVLPPTPKMIEKKTPAEEMRIRENKIAPQVPSSQNDGQEDESISEEESRTLTESIAQWFSSGNKKKTASAPENTTASVHGNPSANKSDSNLFQRLLGLGSSEENSDHVAPTELKLAFQPNRAEISGQTLEWLHAFAENAVQYENVTIEIRMNRNTAYDLQQKRLKLLYTILQNNGVDENKINIIFTDREPNSFIIRNVRNATPEEKAEAEKKNTYSPWY